MSRFEARIAGRIPTPTPVISEIPAAQQKTRQSGEASIAMPTAPFVICRIIATDLIASQLQAQYDNSSPTTPPTRLSTTLSAHNCRTSRQRPAPSASRSASSCSRPEFRAAIKCVRFTHPISSTSITAPIRMEQTSTKLSKAPVFVSKNVALIALSAIG